MTWNDFVKKVEKELSEEQKELDIFYIDTPVWFEYINVKKGNISITIT